MPSNRHSAPEPPDELLKQLKEGRVVPFIGAGFSKAALLTSASSPGRLMGMPTYSELLSQLLEAARLAIPADEEIVRNYLQRSDSEDPDHNDKAAGVLRSSMGEVPFFMTIREILEPIDQRIGSSLAHRFLGLLGFRRIVTTNYDRLLERFAAPGYEVITPKDQQAFRLFMNDERRRFILKLHGDITRPDTIPWGKTELLRYYGYDSFNNPLPSLPEPTVRLRDFLKELFERNAALFLGSSLASAEGFAQVLINLVRDWGGSLPFRHFVVVPYDEKLRDLRKDLEKRMNLHYIYYTPDERHSQVWEFLSFLKAGRPKIEPTPGEPWEQWYHQRERADYLLAQFEREKSATAAHYLTPKLTNAITTLDHLRIDCREELEGRYELEVLERILGAMAVRASNIEQRLREEGLEVRALFLESELRKSLNREAQPREKLLRSIVRYRNLLELLATTDLEVRVIRGLSSEELKREEGSFALIFSQSAGRALADVSIAYSAQANNDFPEIHMVQTNTPELWKHTFTFERLWAAAFNDGETRLLIASLLESVSDLDPLAEAQALPESSAGQPS